VANPDIPVTQLLAEWRAGSDSALSQLSVVLYDELRRLAQRHLRHERGNHTIQRTALVNEAFLRLVGQQSIDWQNRAQFFTLASSFMRRILVDHARARRTAKRGGGAEVVSLDEMSNGHGEGPDSMPTPMALQHRDDDGESHEDLVAIDAALSQLARVDPRQVQVVEMRYFAGMTLEETADALGMSTATVKREWSMARAWLRRRLATANA
jgi:RNA polymerase sigma-70 factor, ECF subfamily